MTDLDYIRSCAVYFRSHQWEYLMELLQRLDQRSHIHLFVDTSIHPRSLEQLIKRYLEQRNCGVNRGNEILSPRPGWGTLHGVHPRDRAHFDVNWRFSSNVVLQPMAEADGEQGKNILFWDEDFMDIVYRNYEWRAVGLDEEAELENYFGSDHWRAAFSMIMDPKLVHIHVNVETCVHPRVLERYIAEDISKRSGWRLHRIVPNVFRTQGVYYGKLMLLFSEPECSFDLSWLYNPDVTIRPSQRQIFPDGDPEYMLVFESALEQMVSADPYYVLTDNEIDRCLRHIEI